MTRDPRKRPGRRPTKAEIAAARGRTLPDILESGLDVWFCGINPSLYSAATGHHFARPGNRFWPALERSGFTPRLLAPWEDGELPEFGAGLTNVAARATARADELSPDELERGARRLERKVRRLSPRCVAFLGVTAYRLAFERPGATVGAQEERLGPASIWVLPNPSGLNAHYQLPELARLFAELRRSVRPGAD